MNSKRVKSSEKASSATNLPKSMKTSASLPNVETKPSASIQEENYLNESTSSITGTKLPIIESSSASKKEPNSTGFYSIKDGAKCYMRHIPGSRKPLTEVHKEGLLPSPDKVCDTRSKNNDAQEDDAKQKDDVDDESIDWAAQIATVAVDSTVPDADAVTTAVVSPTDTVQANTGASTSIETKKTHPTQFYGTKDGCKCYIRHIPGSRKMKEENRSEGPSASSHQHQTNISPQEFVDTTVTSTTTAAAAAAIAAAAPSAVATVPQEPVAVENLDKTQPTDVDDNGKVVLKYVMYAEEFDIVNGQITQAEIDDIYCLSDVMPNCVVHLSRHDALVRREMEEKKKRFEDIHVPENPRGTYHGLESGQVLYVIVEEEAAQKARDQEKMKQVALTMEGSKAKLVDGELTIVRDDGRNFDGCSCIYGKPCTDEYGCRNWSNRFRIAEQNGWKGLESATS